MADLKAAAKRLRESAARQKTEMEIWNSPNAASTNYRARLQQGSNDHVLAAQALEAWAWQQETGASVRQTTGGEFWCAVKIEGQQLTNNYYADTPLGAVLAAREGETDGEA